MVVTLVCLTGDQPGRISSTRPLVIPELSAELVQELTEYIGSVSRGSLAASEVTVWFTCDFLKWKLFERSRPFHHRLYKT